MHGIVVFRNEESVDTVMSQRVHRIDDAETLSEIFDWDIYDIIMDPFASDPISSTQCWLKNANHEREVDDFVQRWNGESIEESIIQCEKEEDALELCNKFRIGRCQKSRDECHWDHILCTAEGTCASTCPYGHKLGMKSEHDSPSSISDISSTVPTPSLANNSSPKDYFQATSVPEDISKSCHDLPVQPKLATYPINHQNRSFQSSWYKERPWLEYSVKADSCYCNYCRHFSSNKLNVGDAFISTGFNNWKRSLDNNGALIKHVSSQSHIIATKNYESYRQRRGTNSSVIDQLDTSRLIHIRRNRDRLLKICSTLNFLSRQMISFRGH
ncbi:unnamed protein product [Rotaria sp. Silwood1]|nr:unnamed protein product [Rotaria sp. Silwood1]